LNADLRRARETRGGGGGHAGGGSEIGAGQKGSIK
jgi:hypothetical protein